MASKPFSTITWSEDEITPRLKALPKKLERAIQGVMVYHSGPVQSYARQNAPWTDRTGNARNGLFAEAFKVTGKQGIVLYHTMPYGLWLEVRFSGKYATILPTIQAKAPDVMRTINKLMGKL